MVNSQQNSVKSFLQLRNHSFNWHTQCHMCLVSILTRFWSTHVVLTDLLRVPDWQTERESHRRRSVDPEWAYTCRSPRGCRHPLMETTDSVCATSPSPVTRLQPYLSLLRYFKSVSVKTFTFNCFRFLEPLQLFYKSQVTIVLKSSIALSKWYVMA